VYTVRLPPSVHGEGDHGFVPLLINNSLEKGVSAYVGDGSNRWPAVHRLDAAALYRLIIEKQPAQRVFHAVAEEGIAFREIAETIGQGLHLQTISQNSEEAQTHFGWFAHFASIDCPASSEKTQVVLGWKPKAVGLIGDMRTGGYFSK
jgi:nucleoside-diphosphate-sugar epimerase